MADDQSGQPSGLALTEGLGAMSETTIDRPARDALGLLAEVAEERMRQDAKWGGPAHDDEHSTAAFVQLIQDYAAWARVMAGMGSRDKARRRLVQVAALAVAAVESLERQGGLTPEEEDEAQAMNDMAPAA